MLSDRITPEGYGTCVEAENARDAAGTVARHINFILAWESGLVESTFQNVAYSDAPEC